MAFNLLQHASRGRLKKLKKSLDSGVHIDAASTKKETALFCSSLHGHVNCVKYLLARGADPNRSNIKGMIPLHAAIKNDHVKCVGLLLQYGSDLLRLFGEFPTILAYARYHGNPEMVRLIKAFMEGSGVRNHRSAQNYNVVVMATSASSSCRQISETKKDKIAEGIPVIDAEDLKKPDPCKSLKGPFFVYVDAMWRGSPVTVKHGPGCDEGEFYYISLRKEINILRQLRHFRFPVAMAICYDPFCLIMERFCHFSLSRYLRDPNVEMEMDKEIHLARIVRIMLDVAQALAHLHDKKWVHCHVTSQSIFVFDGPRAKLGSLEFCQRPGEPLEHLECFQEELPWLAPEVYQGGQVNCPGDIYSLGATFWECLTLHTPWSWLPETQIPASRELPVLNAWPSLLQSFLFRCFQEADHRPSANDVCSKLEKITDLGIQVNRFQLDEFFKDWLTEHSKQAKYGHSSISRSLKSSTSSRSSFLTSIALGEKYQRLKKDVTKTEDDDNIHRGLKKNGSKGHRRSAVVTALVEEALKTWVHVGLISTEVREADVFKFGFKLARDIAELRGLCSLAQKTPRKMWAKVAMATRDLEEDMFDSLVGYEEVTFRRKHAHAMNLRKVKQERTQEKLKETLQRTRSLIKRRKRKNWACYTMLLCEFYGILRRTDTVEDEENEDFEKEALNQSIIHLGSQMRKISSIMLNSTNEEPHSGKLSQEGPISLTCLTRVCSDSLRDDLDEFEQAAIDNEQNFDKSERQSRYLESMCFYVV